MELQAKNLPLDEALTLWYQMSHLVPDQAYPLGIDVVRFDDDAEGNAWRYGVVGGEATIDLEFETKKGGPWGVWLISQSRDLYVAVHPSAPIDRLLYFISRRNCCFMNIHTSWHLMVGAAAKAAFTQIGTVNNYGVWTRHAHEYHLAHS